MENIEMMKLDNGLQVISCPLPYMRSVSIVIGIRSGSVYENKKLRGISHFIEHMLFKGTKKRKNTLEISQCIEELGGEINASTSEECTFIYSKVLHKNFTSALDVLIDILNNSLFKEDDIKHEKTVITEEINKYQDIPEDWICFLINQLLWRKTPLAHNVLGEKETVNNFDRNTILDYFYRAYQPENMVIGISGNITMEIIKKAIKNTPLNTVKEKYDPSIPIIKTKQQNAPEWKFIPRKVNQAHLCFGFETISRFHPDKITMDLLNIILGAGLSSRLFQKIRVKEGLSYDIHSYTQYFNDTGSFNIYTGVDPDKVDRSVEIILKELTELKNNIVGAKELRKAKEMYKGSILLSLENTLSHAFRLGSYLLLYRKKYLYLDLIEKIERIKADDIRNLSQRVFLKNKINLIVFYPVNIKINKNDLIDKLEI